MPAKNTEYHNPELAFSHSPLRSPNSEHPHLYNAPDHSVSSPSSDGSAKPKGPRSSSPLLHFLTYLLFLILSMSLFIHPLFAIDSLSYKVGQMVMTGFYPGSNFEDTLYYDIEHRNLGGVIYMGYNLDSPTQIANLSASLQASAETPLLIATDQEGGIVARLDENNGFARTDKAIDLGNANHELTTRIQSALMAGWLSSSGINTNLAPVADVNVNPQSPAIGSYGRSFSADPLIVKDHVYWFWDEMQKQDIITSLKHFPGHGSAIGDSHDGFTDVTDTWSEQELIPYSTMIDTGYSGMVMTAHLYNAHIDTMYPATLSKPTLSGILRDSLGFEGVIITDDMRMGAISGLYGFSESVVRAIDAGVDILLYVGNEKFGSSVLKQIVKVVKNAIAADQLTEERIDESYDRIMKMKSENNTSVRPIIANDFELKAYPNPFNPATKISFKIEDEICETAQLTVFSVDGRLVQRYFIKLNGPGNYDVTWNATDLYGRNIPSGTYIYSLKVNERSYTGKMTFLK